MIVYHNDRRDAMKGDGELRDRMLLMPKILHGCLVLISWHKICIRLAIIL